MSEPMSVLRAVRMFGVIFVEQLHGFFDNLNDAFLPPSCKNWWSGLTGLLYALPLLSHNRMTSLGKLSWLLQALLSVLADYSYIGHSHPIHGIDRYLATFNCFRVLGVGVDAKLWLHVVLAPIPLGCHLLARIAKVDMNESVEGTPEFERHRQLWITMHGWWHVTGALLIALMYESEMRLWLSKQKRSKEAPAIADQKRAESAKTKSVVSRGRKPKTDEAEDSVEKTTPKAARSKSKSRERTKSKSTGSRRRGRQAL